MQRFFFLALAVSVLHFERVFCYPTGLISAACDNMLPQHGQKAQTTPALYTVTASATSFQPGDQITVTLQANAGNTFKGFLLEARAVAGDGLVGVFQTSDSQAQTLACSGVKNTGVSHTSAASKSSITAIWIAPSGSSQFRFRATFVQEFSTFWTNVESQILLPGQSNSTARPTTTPSIVPIGLNQTKEITTKNSSQYSTLLATEDTLKTSKPNQVQIASTNCGSTKYCFSNSTGCDPASDPTCFFMSFAPVSGGGFLYEISGTSDGFVAVGFSDDEIMGNDDMYICVINTDGKVVIQRGASTTQKTVNQSVSITVQNSITSFNNGVIQCSFTTTNNISTPARASGSSFYIFLARGPASNGILQKHTTTPLITSEKVNISQMNPTLAPASSSSSIDTYKKAHGALMLIAWMTTGSIGMVFARYMKNSAKKLFFGKALWFQVHQLLMVLSVVATSVAFIVIFSCEASWDADHADHAVIGCIVMILSFFQPIIALFRPDPKHSRRIIFNWFHGLNAFVIKILAVAALFLGFQIIDRSSNLWLPKTLGGFVGWEALTAIVLEVNAFVMKRRSSPYEVVDKKMDRTTVIVIIYVLVNVAFLIALLVGIGQS